MDTKKADIINIGFNVERKRSDSISDSDPHRKPRSSSFKDADTFVYRGGSFVRPDSDSFHNPTTGSGSGTGSGQQSRSGSGSGMPDFRSAIKTQLRKTQDEMPKGPMREMMETYKPHILTRRRQLIEDCVRDLRLNNDHIHIVEQEMRIAIQVSKLNLTTVCMLKAKITNNFNNFGVKRYFSNYLYSFRL